MTEQINNKLREIWRNELEEIRDLPGILRFLMYFVDILAIDHLNPVIDTLSQEARNRVKESLSEISNISATRKETFLIPARAPIDDQTLPTFYQRGVPQMHYCPNDDYNRIIAMKQYLLQMIELYSVAN